MFLFVFTRLEASTAVDADSLGILPGVCSLLDGIQQLSLARKDPLPSNLVHAMDWAVLAHYAVPRNVYLSVLIEWGRSGVASHQVWL